MTDPRRKSSRFFAALAALWLGAFSASPAAAQLVALEPQDAGPDFAVQGEYAGKFTGPDTVVAGRLGAQVVAQGDGNFRVIFFPGGLPGDGWNGKERFAYAAKSDSGRPGNMQVTGDAYQARLVGDTLTAGNGRGWPYVLTRQNRSSPTLGLPPPPHATVLFDGSSLAEWDNAEVDARRFFAPLAPVAMTRRKFSNFSLHLEFRLPFIPFAMGQTRANSGLKFLIAKFLFAEIQILDSFGNEPREDECGGIEVQYPPDVVASFPPLAWQTYDIHLITPVSADSEAVGKGYMTVWHNGILIHPGRELGSMVSAVNIALQKNGDPVYFRNMWILDGDPAYPFFPGAAIVIGKAVRPHSQRQGTEGGKPGSSLVRHRALLGQDAAYLSDGRRVFP